MSLYSQYRLIVWLCLVCAACLGSKGVVPCQALEEAAPSPQLSQTDPAYVQLMAVLELVGQARLAVAENISHANVTAYKRNVVGFTGTDYISITRDMRPGSLVHTGRRLDWAIKGAGWFQLSLPDGRTAYTRQGIFSLGPDGAIMSEWGLTLEPAISVPADNRAIVVARDGTVSCFQNDGEVLTVGVIQLARFTSAESLRHHDHGTYLESAAAGYPVLGTPGEDGFGSIECGSQEKSNVNVLQEQHLLEDLNRYETQLHQAVNQLRHRSPVTPDASSQATEFQVPLGMLQAGFECRTRTEQQLKRKAEALLFAIVGPQRARVSVSADLDLAFSCKTTERPLAGHPTMKQEDVTKEDAKAGDTEPGGRANGTKSVASTMVEYAVGQATEKTVSVPGHVVGLSVAVLIDLRDPTVKHNRMLMSIEDIDQLIRAGLGLKPDDVLVIKQATLVFP
jgi:flagellar basal-body rod protein FlgG